jgi:hypothetical protein
VWCAQHGGALAGERQIRTDGDAARQPEGAHATAVGEPWKQLRSKGIRCAAIDDHRGRHARQERAGTQFASLCLEHHGQLGQSEARPTVLFGDRQALPTDADGCRPQVGGVGRARCVLVEGRPGRSAALQLSELAIRGVGQIAVVVGDR